MRPRLSANRRQQQQQQLKHQNKQQQQQQQVQNEPSISVNYQTSTYEFSGHQNYHFTPTTKGGFWRPIPMIGHEGPLQFEVIMFAYMGVALFLQHLHIYKSVWWLPHSYNSFAMNFYLIDPLIIAFSLLVLVRRLIWTLIKNLIYLMIPPNWTESFILVLRSLTTFFILISLLFLAHLIIQQHPVVNILYLAYPVAVYLLLFGFSGDPFLELMPAPPSGKIKFNKDSTGVYRTTTHQLQQQQLTKGEGGLCQPELIRQEVLVLKTDFNSRLKQVLFNSIVSVYYAAFVPCCFAPHAVHYDFAWVGRHALLVWVGGFVLYLVHAFPSGYTHMMHRTAQILGQWTKIEGRISHTFYNQWSGNMIWPCGSIVRYGKELYKAEAEMNSAEPGSSSQSRFYSLFREPTSVLTVLLMVQSGLVLAQHLSLTWSSQWYQLISESLMLFANYYALFQLVRDYMVFWKMFESFDKCKDNTNKSD